MKIKCLIISAFLLMTACSKSYEDCVLEELKNANSDTAARIISKACEEKYGSPAYKLREKESEVSAPYAEAAPAESTAEESYEQAPSAEDAEKIIGLQSEINKD